MWKTVLEDYNLTRPEDEPIFRELYLNSTYQPDQVHVPIFKKLYVSYTPRNTQRSGGEGCTC